MKSFAGHSEHLCSSSAKNLVFRSFVAKNAPQDDDNIIVILRERSDRRIQILRPSGAQDDDRRKNAPQDDDNIIVILRSGATEESRSFAPAALRMTEL